MGNAAEWVSAIASVGALLAAVVAGYAAWRLYRVESERDKVAAWRRLSEQARLVPAWIAVVVDDEGRVASTGLMVVNRAESPIFDIRISATDKESDLIRTPAKMAMLPPGRYFVARQGAPFTWAYADSADSVEGVIRPVTKTDKWRVDQLEFVDSGNVAWSRDRHGRLRDRLISDYVP